MSSKAVRMEFLTESCPDEPDDREGGIAALADDIGPLTEPSAAPASRCDARPAARWQSAGPFLLSVLIHGLIVIVLAKVGLLNAPAWVSIRSGGANGDRIDLPGDGLPPMRADPAVDIPLAAPIAAAPAPDAPPPLDPAAEWTSPVSSHTDSAVLLAANDSAVIGLSLSAEAVPQFSHTLPEGVRRSIARSSVGEPSSSQGNGTADLPVAIGPHREGTSESPGTGGGSQRATGAVPSASSRNRAPAYPREARRLRQEGRVLLLVEVMEDGAVGSITVIRSSGYEVLDQAAIEAVQRWQFTPAYIDGHPARSKGEVPVEFSLRG